jgi:CHAD domain-containing protein
MARLTVGRKSFERSYRARVRALLELGNGLPDRPSASDIHDLRVIARRVQVMRRLLPRSGRSSQASRHFDLSIRSVLKATSQLRDLDTLLETLEPYRESLPAEVFGRLGNQRSDGAARAKVATSVLVEVPPPDLEAYWTRGKRLSRRLRKSVRKRSREAADLVSKVVLDESNVTELHSLRKVVKKMRYLLELANGSPPELELLTKWQESLGRVHDIDVALDFVRGSQVEFKGRLVRQLERIRHQSYAKFITEYKVGSVLSLESGKLLAGRPVLPTT